MKTMKYESVSISMYIFIYMVMHIFIHKRVIFCSFFCAILNSGIVALTFIAVTWQGGGYSLSNQEIHYATSTSTHSIYRVTHAHTHTYLSLSLSPSRSRYSHGGFLKYSSHDPNFRLGLSLN